MTKKQIAERRKRVAKECQSLQIVDCLRGKGKIKESKDGNFLFVLHWLQGQWNTNNIADWDLAISSLSFRNMLHPLQISSADAYCWVMTLLESNIVLLRYANTRGLYNKRNDRR